jgi:hypothetical protein
MYNRPSVGEAARRCSSFNMDGGGGNRGNMMSAKDENQILLNFPQMSGYMGGDSNMFQGVDGSTPNEPNPLRSFPPTPNISPNAVDHHGEAVFTFDGIHSYSNPPTPIEQELLDQTAIHLLACNLQQNIEQASYYENYPQHNMAEDMGNQMDPFYGNQRFYNNNNANLNTFKGIMDSNTAFHGMFNAPFPGPGEI